MILKGATREVQRFVDTLCAEHGVHHGKVILIGVETHEPHRKSRGTRFGSRDTRTGTAPAPSHLHVEPAT